MAEVGTALSLVRLGRSRTWRIVAALHSFAFWGTPKGMNIMVCSLFVTSFQRKGEHYHCLLFVGSICYVPIFRLCSVSIFSLCSVSIFSPCYVVSLVCVRCVVFRRVAPALRACGSLRLLAAASRSQGISPNILVFVVYGLTFMDVSALGYTLASYL